MSASYVLERLLADRRITHAEIARYLEEMQDEIRAIEERLARLRALVPSNALRIASNTAIASNARIAPNRRIPYNKVASKGVAPNASPVKAR